MDVLYPHIVALRTSIGEWHRRVVVLNRLDEVTARPVISIPWIHLREVVDSVNPKICGTGESEIAISRIRSTTMVRRTVVIAVGIVVVLAAAAAGLVVSMPANAEPTYAPDELQGYNQTKNITGEQAKSIISELHRQPEAVQGYRNGVVAEYGSGDQPVMRLFVSVHNESEEATNNVTMMVRVMNESPMFTVQNTTIASQSVYIVEQDRVAYVIFNYRDAAYWVTYSRSADVTPTGIVTEVVETNRQSRKRFPWL